MRIKKDLHQLISYAIFSAEKMIEISLKRGGKYMYSLLSYVLYLFFTYFRL